MKYLYPTSYNFSTLTKAQLSLKIARHSPCSVCSTCKGLHPTPDTEIVLDDGSNPPLLGDLGQYGSDDDEPTSYIGTCSCGHTAAEHGANEHEIGPEEFRRRSQVAVRLDELLQEVNKLLDFEYSDEDIANLRQRMELPVSFVAPTFPTQGVNSPGKTVFWREVITH
ncbi:hypothetical protein L218DRAFT_927786 [Marasmius fiardii PR-910]|nr:hypothetical protein L218DRAFT_927786 [Marasmius fiardii PR-910]